MKTIHELFHEFRKLKTPSDDDYMKLGHDLATNIVYAPKNEQELLWKFVKDKFSEDKNRLINFGANFYLKLHEQKEKMERKTNETPENIAPKEEVKPVVVELPKKEEKPIVIEIPKTEKIKEVSPPLIQKVIQPVERDEHKEKIALKVKEIQGSVTKLESNLVSLKELQNPTPTMKMAIDALEKLREQLDSKYKPPKI